MLGHLSRERVLPDAAPPTGSDLIERGRKRAASFDIPQSRFQRERDVKCEAAFKIAMAAAGRPMFHAQAGWRDPEVTAANMAEISARVREAGGHVDRYGICLDWSMGYPPDARGGRNQGTGLVLRSDDDFRLLAEATDAAAHFGDFVIGMPAAVENTVAALRAGSTSIGNLGQYFTFRLPDWDDDALIAAATVEAIAICAVQPVDIIVHSNLDDGFAARFSDLACTLGAALIERYIVEQLLGARIGHCYGHTFSGLKERQAFHLALSEASPGPGSMIYGNTTRFGDDDAANYAVLASYLGADMAALRWAPSGHAVTPIPVTEARRIPSVDEIVDAQVFAATLAERLADTLPPDPPEAVRSLGVEIALGGRAFFDNVMNGLGELGYVTDDPYELLLAIRRIGAPALERAFGPGRADERGYYGRAPLVESSVVGEISAQAEQIIAGLEPDVADGIKRRCPKVCIATTDVHEYGKRLVEQVLAKLGLETVDGGIGVDADDLLQTAADAGADAIAVSTYNGVAAAFVQQIAGEMATGPYRPQVFIGGRLNAVPDGTNTGMPVDVADEIGGTGAIPCARIEDMLAVLAQGSGDKK
ncbi:MAG: cobalamin-dependent protein [Rhodospirillales bacterium]|nr:cobalamin-dependent protein [Rhodospirillales bacterium]MBO6788065.1 cobalamin-dependent protein [Rhodospirillales bacterium]